MTEDVLSRWDAEELERERLTLLERFHDPLRATADEDVDEPQRLLQDLAVLFRSPMTVLARERRPE